MFDTLTMALLDTQIDRTSLVALSYVSSIPRVWQFLCLHCITQLVTGNPLHVSVTKHSTASSTCGYLPSLGPVKHFVALQENMELRSFLQRRTLAELASEARPLLCCHAFPHRQQPCFSAEPQCNLSEDIFKCQLSLTHLTSTTQ